MARLIGFKNGSFEQNWHGICKCGFWALIENLNRYEDAPQDWLIMKKTTAKLK